MGWLKWISRNKSPWLCGFSDIIPDFQGKFPAFWSSTLKSPIFLSFEGHNFEETVTNFDKDIFRKESLTYKISNLQFSVIFHLVAKCAVKTNSSIIICFQLSNSVFYLLFHILRKMLQKIEYSKSQTAKKVPVQMPNIREAIHTHLLHVSSGCLEITFKPTLPSPIIHEFSGL